MNRIIKLKEVLKKKHIGAFIILNLRNIYYLTGFTGTNGFLVISNRRDRRRVFFFTDFRYKERCETELQGSGIEIIICKGDCLRFIEEFLKKRGIKKLSIEDSVSLKIYKHLSKTFTLYSVSDIVEEIRIIKDAQELTSIKEAVQRAESAFLKIKGYIRHGITEIALAKRLDDAIRDTGARYPSFDTIVASGSNSAIPHAAPSQKKLKRGDLIVIDWGAECNGYLSDMTRTFLLNGDGLEKKIEIYNVVYSANISAISNFSINSPIKSIDKTARGIIINAGYGEYFGHGTGHGVGLDIHESPSIGAYSKSKRVASGMVFTIEPGIYLPNIGGVRIEDMVTISPNSIIVLTTLNKELEII